MHNAHQGITLSPITKPDFPLLRTLAATIWRQHYAVIISAPQIDYMLAGRLGDENLRGYLWAADRWLELLRVAGSPVGYCGSELSLEHPTELKLGQLYVLEPHRGQGLGKRMLAHVETRACDLGRPTLVLQVNRQNTGAIAFYESAGFRIRREAVFDIGNGFVMDDYVMVKPLGTVGPSPV